MARNSCLISLPNIAEHLPEQLIHAAAALLTDLVDAGLEHDAAVSDKMTSSRMFSTSAIRCVEMTMDAFSSKFVRIVRMM